MKHSYITAKPKTTKEQIDMVWVACFNDLPSQITLLDRKFNFTLALLGVIIALVAVVLVR